MSQFKPVLTPKERCEECGFVYADVSPEEALDLFRAAHR